MTTVYPEGARGSLVREADVELNTRWFLSRPLDSVGSDLKVVLVHEIGHLLGLEDACGLNHQRAFNDLAACPAHERDSVMFPPASLSNPSARDIEVLCQLYPRAASNDLGTSLDTTPTRSPGSCGCNLLHPSGPTIAPLVFLLAFAARRLNRVPQFFTKLRALITPRWR
jgi:hypothetical protein